MKNAEIELIKNKIGTLKFELQVQKEKLKKLEDAEADNVDVDSYSGKFFEFKNTPYDSNYYFCYVKKPIVYNRSLNCIECNGTTIFDNSTMMKSSFYISNGSFLLPVESKEITEEKFDTYKNRIIKQLNEVKN